MKISIVLFFVAITVAGDSDSRWYFDLSPEDRLIYARGVIDGFEASVIMSIQNKPFAIDMTPEEITNKIFDGIEPSMLSRLVREFTKIYLRRKYGESNL
jgi:hypothetical protein